MKMHHTDEELIKGYQWTESNLKKELTNPKAKHATELKNIQKEGADKDAQIEQLISDIKVSLTNEIRMKSGQRLRRRPLSLLKCISKRGGRSLRRPRKR